MVLERFGPMGRKHLGEALNLPEGVTRGLVTDLQRRGLVETRRDGCRISALGFESLRAELIKRGVESLTEISAESLGIGPFVVSAHVKAASHRVRLGIEERDLSVRAGAKGAVTIVYTDGVLRMPGVSGDLLQYEPQLAKAVLSRLHLEDGDVVLLVFADNYYRALEAALLTSTALGQERGEQPLYVMGTSVQALSRGLGAPSLRARGWRRSSSQK
ncbi:MAG: DUF4443 domain-containing protein [Candidatus Bathyarchaeia archaeon]